MRATVLVALLVAATPADAERRPKRHFDIVNAAHDSVISLSVAPAGSDAYREVALGAPLRGGLGSTTVALPSGGCLRDFRLVFRDGRTLIYPAIDICRRGRLRLTAKDGRQDGRALRAPSP
ncbi:hypothetical protein [Luteimonas sp. R10]|uniref:hypothetical protein n=1 Tax=Luteimonas sp. R10 TaxID=3108176 RepID=UPI00308D5FD5|nr:hypothetical protein U3649_09990 [Luteimonas sp. R10]